MSDYNEYKKYLDRFTGSTARPYTPRWREVMEILHYVPFINLKDAENSIQKNVFKSLGFFHQNDLTETERKKVLLRMKKSLKEITDLIGDVIDEELKACEVFESADEKFINTFQDSFKYPKKQTSELCGMGETWIHTYKKEFKQDFHGVFIKDFLKWLMKEKPKAFATFKKNWKILNK